MLKIQKQIPIPKTLSDKSISQILDSYFANKYKLDWITKSKVRLKKLHGFKSNGREIIQKKLIPSNTGFITIQKKILNFSLLLDKQLFASIFSGFLLTFILWKGFNISFNISVLIVTLLLIISWVAIIKFGLRFLKRTLLELKEKIN